MDPDSDPKKHRKVKTGSGRTHSSLSVDIYNYLISNFDLSVGTYIASCLLNSEELFLSIDYHLCVFISFRSYNGTNFIGKCDNVYDSNNNMGRNYCLLNNISITGGTSR